MINQMVIDLLAAGWTEVRFGLWKSPSGLMFRGPALAHSKIQEIAVLEAHPEKLHAAKKRLMIADGQAAKSTAEGVDK